MSLVPAHLWSEDEFQEARDASVVLFRDKRMAEDLGAYSDEFELARQKVASLLELTVDLTAIMDDTVAVVSDADMLVALRYLAGPPISEDDLKTLGDIATLNPTKVKAEPKRADSAVETVLLGLDGGRFPWVREDREPTDEEREIAIVATAALMAQRRVMTARANESKDEQEKLVASTLVASGFTQVATRAVATYDDAPKPGEFCHEADFAGRKADLIVTLWDGRFMPTECKVSNSSTNSVKRLNNDAAVKAKHWISAFGTQQTVPAAVLGGVFNLKNLKSAQADGLTIWWAHGLDEMIKWIDSTKP